MEIFEKYKEDRVPHELLYVLSRTGLFLVVNLFSAFIGIILCSGVATALSIIFRSESSFVTLKLIPFINRDTTVSAVSCLILLCVMLVLFWDDGKRHTAYERFSMPVSTAAVFFMFVVYVIPSIFLEDARDSVSAAIRSFYKPAMWVGTPQNGSLTIPVVVSAGIVCILCLVAYKLSGDRYLKKHPELL